jgi:uncharacterized protein (DUF58 family)
MRPTPRLALFFAVATPLSVILGALAPNLWLVTFAIPTTLLAAFLLDAALTLPQNRLRLTAQTRSRIFIGTPLTLAADLQTATNTQPTNFEILVDATGDFDPPPPQTARATPNAPTTILLTLTPTRRGQIHIAALKLRWHGPFRLNQRLHTIPLNLTTNVVPDIRAVQTGVLQFSDRDSPAGLKMQRDRGAGTEFDNLRDFTPGMDIAAVDWKHSARHLNLVAREMRVERNHQIILAWDTGLLMRAPINGIPRLDLAISAGLLLGYIALRGGDSVGTYAFDSRIRAYAPPIGGTGAFARLQHQAATLDYNAEETNFTLGLAELQARLKRRALVVLFTDFVDTVTAELMAERLGALALRHVVVFVSLRDPLLQSLMDSPPTEAAALGQAVVASDFLRERRIVFARLQRLGIHCLDADRGAINANLINRYVAIKQRGLL